MRAKNNMEQKSEKGYCRKWALIAYNPLRIRKFLALKSDTIRPSLVDS